MFYFRNTLSFLEINKPKLTQKCILNLPDEVIEEIMKFLSYSDIGNLNKVAKRFQDCGKRVLKHIPFCKHDTQNSFDQALFIHTITQLKIYYSCNYNRI